MRLAPIQIARYIHEKYRMVGLPFEEKLGEHLKHGYVYNSPECFIMGRPVDSKADSDDILDYSKEFSEPDCWYVCLAVGIKKLNDLINLMPYDLPLVGWQRMSGDIRYYNTKRLKKFTG
jgi:hypothetical protein